MLVGDWVDDIDMHTTKQLTTTGGTVWNAARRCASFLMSEANSIGLDRPGVRVLELGAGCGLLGLLVARNTPGAAEVCLTEQAYGGALKHLSLNVQHNSHLPNMAAVTTCACDWTHFMDTELVQAVRTGAAPGSGNYNRLQGTPAAAAAAAADSCCPGHAQQAVPETCVKSEQQEPDLMTATAAGQPACLDGHGSSGSSSSAPPSAAELADMAHLLCSHWDIIIGSDLVYNSAGVMGLPRVLAALMQPLNSCSSSTTIHPSTATEPHQQQQQQQQQRQRQRQTIMYYAHTKHRFDAMDVDLFDQLEASRLCVQEVIESGQELAPPSPPPFSSLYPEMRCAVFKISRPAAAEQVA